MTSTEKAIGFLRTLTFDGYLSSDEVWLLAKYLNENADCRTEWPGNLLFPLLHMAFADGELSEGEMTILATTIASVEQQWIKKKSDTTRIASPPSLPEEELGLLELPLMPQLNSSVQIPSFSSDEIYNVSLFNHSCDCPDWGQRQTWPAGHLGRCCKHVATAFNASGIGLEPWFQSVLDDLTRRSRGTHPSDDWVKIQVGRRKPIVASGGSGEWHNIFASTSDGYGRYGYNRTQNRWSYGEAPHGAPQIAKAVRERFALA